MGNKSSQTRWLKTAEVDSPPVWGPESAIKVSAGPAGLLVSPGIPWLVNASLRPLLLSHAASPCACVVSTSVLYRRSSSAQVPHAERRMIPSHDLTSLHWKDPFPKQSNIQETWMLGLERIFWGHDSTRHAHQTQCSTRSP